MCWWKIFVIESEGWFPSPVKNAITKGLRKCAISSFYYFQTTLSSIVPFSLFSHLYSFSDPEVGDLALAVVEGRHAVGVGPATESLCDTGRRDVLSKETGKGRENENGNVNGRGSENVKESESESGGSGWEKQGGERQLLFADLHQEGGITFLMIKARIFM